jgi:hypothetical protein
MRHARTITGLPILMSLLVASVLVGCSQGAFNAASAPRVAVPAASLLSAKQLALAASTLSDFTLVEDHSRTIEEIAALYKDPAASAAELRAHGFRESWLREFVRPAGASGHAIRLLNTVSVYDQEAGSRWALGHNIERIRSLPVVSVTALPFSFGDESYAYMIEIAGPVVVVRSATVYVRVSNVSYTLVETGVAADVDPEVLIDLARSQLLGVIADRKLLSK